MANFEVKKSFCQYFNTFTGLIKRTCLNKSIFPQDLPFLNLLRKKKYLSISVLLSEIVNFFTKKISSLLISPKIIKNNRKAEFSYMWLNSRRKTSCCFYFPHFTGLIKKLFKKIQIFLRICPFSILLRGGISHFPPKFEHIFVVVITFPPFLLCK